ncbi:M3 family metallopeptidase [Derxia gummosa]|uniref:M3 family metallopeptidase n=1 Tax=Derxia gummosa DSM 723 TaxID=1121388 RepID=A0A8B6XA96_9BURK|nr:M3 family metallopeptidase [Derxia gummosa]
MSRLPAPSLASGPRPSSLPRRAGLGAVLARAALLAAVAAVGPVAAEAAEAAVPRTLLPAFTARDIQAGCDRQLARARQLKAAIEAKTEPAGVLAEINELSRQTEDFFGPLELVANTFTSKATRDAADACLLRYTPFTTELYQSEAIYRRVRDLPATDDIDAAYRRDLLDAFDDNGVSLPPERRARASELQSRLSDLGQQFSKRLREDRTVVVMTPADMDGLPPAYLKARQRDAAGNYLLDLSYPQYRPFMELARREDARRRYWLAFQRKGGTDNLALLDQLVATRTELAALHGDPDYATWAMRRRMTGNPQTVFDFLGQVERAVTEGEKADVATLRDAKARELGKPPAEVRIERWDTAYYDTLVRKQRFDIDQDALRKHFPTEAAIAFALRINEQLYGLRFVERKVKAWHPDVRYFDVFDADADGKPGEFVAGVYLDLFPRKDKYAHAAAFSLRNASGLLGRRPLGALVTNFNRDGLDHDELETLLHEFGHVMHGALSRTRWLDQSGTAVKRDFVEAPSQMAEEWAWQRESLALFGQLCKTCPPLSDALIGKLQAARHFGAGLRYARQWLYASYDMRLYSGAPQDAEALWDRLEGATPLGHVPDTLFPAGFEHIASGGYAAGYYGYLWSQVLALDMASVFRGGHMLDPALGRRYRDEVLSQGGQRDPKAMVERFLGRPISNAAFMEELGVPAAPAVPGAEAAPTPSTAAATGDRPVHDAAPATAPERRAPAASRP